MAFAAIPLKNWRSFQTPTELLKPSVGRKHFELTPGKLAVETTQE